MDQPEDARELIAYIEDAPSPYHATAATAEILESAGFRRLEERTAWDGATARAHVVQGGTLIAWSDDPEGEPGRPFRIVGAHTDSPNLRVKPRPDTGAAGFRQLGVEVYGGALLNSWLDRDLGISGRVAVPGHDGLDQRLIRVDRPLMRIPQLAIHLDREVNDKGLRLDRQRHLAPVWDLGPATDGDFAGFLAGELGVTEVLGWDVMAHDLTPGTLLGRGDEMLCASRIDNLASCWAAARALIDATPDTRTAVICLYDHEEIGSVSATGADGALLARVLERVVAARGGDREDLLRALAGSMCVSADGAHATHPNYSERHEPDHWVHLNAGPVLKHNANIRYATDAGTEAAFRLACADAGVPTQDFVSRSDLPCGSTIGPVTAARLGVPTVDVGMPQLSMHSARELAGSRDPAMFRRALTAFLSA